MKTATYPQGKTERNHDENGIGPDAPKGHPAHIPCGFLVISRAVNLGQFTAGRMLFLTGWSCTGDVAAEPLRQTLQLLFVFGRGRVDHVDHQYRWTFPTFFDGG